MKKILLVLLFMIIFTLYGCSSGGEEPPTNITTSFYEEFSLSSLIEHNDAFLEGRVSISGRDESGKSQKPHQKQEIAALQIEPGNISEFILAVRTSIESALNRDEIIITGQGADLTRADKQPADAIAFSYRYRQGEVDGVINVWGIPGEGTDFTLITLVTE